MLDRNDLALAMEQRQAEVVLPRVFDSVLQEGDPFQRMGYRYPWQSPASPAGDVSSILMQFPR